MKKSVEILGLPVISITEGRELGMSKSLLVDAKNGKIAAITIEDEDWYRGVKLLPYESVIAIGEDAVTITNSENIITLEDAGDYENMLDEHIRVIGTKAITRSGTIQGKITEMYIGEGGKIEKCEITAEDGNVSEIASDQISIFGKQVTVIDPEQEEKKTEIVSPPAPAEPKMEMPQAELPTVEEPPKAELPIMEEPEPEPPAVEIPQAEEPKDAVPEAPVMPEPEKEAPAEMELPETEEPKADIPQEEDSSAEAAPLSVPGAPEPAEEKPEEKEELPKAEEPENETPKEEVPEAEAEPAKAEIPAEEPAKPEPPQAPIMPELPKTEPATPAMPKATPDKAAEERHRRFLLNKEATRTIKTDNGILIIEAGQRVTEEVLQKAKLANKFIELSMNVK